MKLAGTGALPVVGGSAKLRVPAAIIHTRSNFVCGADVAALKNAYNYQRVASPRPAVHGKSGAGCRANVSFSLVLMPLNKERSHILRHGTNAYQIRREADVLQPWRYLFSGRLHGSFAASPSICRHVTHHMSDWHSTRRRPFSDSDWHSECVYRKCEMDGLFTDGDG